MINNKKIKKWLKKSQVILKLLSFLKPNNSSLKFFIFESKISSKTWKRHDDIIRWSERCLENKDGLEENELYLESKDPIVKQGYLLKEKIITEYKDKYIKSNYRILIHIPPVELSPAGYSLFNNLLESFIFLGIAAEKFDWNDSFENIVNNFKPNIFLSSDNAEYIKKVNWNVLAQYKKNNNLKIGFTASLEEYGNSPLIERLKFGNNKGIDFYYSFRSPEYIVERKEYQPFFKEGFPVLNIEFGANPLIYYPIPNIDRDLNYVFLASSNPAKWNRYFSYLENIFSKYDGFINGPGWSRIEKFKFNRNRDRYIYARAKVGINLSLIEQIEWPCELNERTYMLAACGVPQLIDNPKLLVSRYGTDSMFMASNPKEYYDLYKHIIANPDIAVKKALVAQKMTFDKHTIFHRIESFITQLDQVIGR